MKIICIIDGQGGGIGSTIIKSLLDFGNNLFEIVALGTNAIATAQMLKAGANRGASGENAIVQTVQKVDIIVGPVSILAANAMMGEITPKIAEAVSSSPARKYLLPLTQDNIEIVGVSPLPLPHLIQALTKKSLKSFIADAGLSDHSAD
ncbi:MAG: DUF3842 family protein [Thermodesulfobacteriota bacterium]